MPFTNFDIKNWAYKHGGRRALRVVQRFQAELKELHQTEGSQVLEREIGMIGGGFNAWVRAGSKIPVEGKEEELVEGDQDVIQIMLQEILNLLALQELLVLDEEDIEQIEEDGDDEGLMMSDSQLEKLERWEFVQEWQIHSVIEGFQVARAQMGRLVAYEPREQE
jgi:hypothetical protein